MRKGFTLLEVLLVVAAIAILAGIVILAINPAKQLAEARNATRHADVKTVLDAVYQYSIDNNGDFPAGLDTTLRVIGTSGSGCDMECGAISGESGSFSVSSEAGFDAGTYYALPPDPAETQYDAGNEWVELAETGITTGRYASEIFDAGGETLWSTFSWVPNRPSGKELPNDGVSETGYPTGNADMSSIAVLYHLNETSGNVVDHSGNGHTLAPTNFEGNEYTTTGILNTALNLDDDTLVGPSSNAITGDNLQTITFSAWVRHTYSGDNGYIASLKQSSGDSTLISLDAGNGGAGNLGFLTRNAANTSHAWLNHNGGYNDGEWHHLVAVVDGAQRILYVDGVERATDNQGMRSVTGNTAAFTVGSFAPGQYEFAGDIDEVAIWRRALSPQEIEDLYVRGATKLTFGFRTCTIESCNDVSSFTGSFSEETSTSATPPSLTLSVGSDRYFQYQATFETVNDAFSPQLVSTVTHYAAGGVDGEVTDASCIDLSSYLSPSYIVDVPYDPQEGSSENTTYAIKKTANGRITVKACSVELDEAITITR
jgi:prepilin-type N-terminal cleavage/methylation domain-containing protein